MRTVEEIRALQINAACCLGELGGKIARHKRICDPCVDKMELQHVWLAGAVKSLACYLPADAVVVEGASSTAILDFVSLIDGGYYELTVSFDGNVIATIEDYYASLDLMIDEIVTQATPAMALLGWTLIKDGTELTVINDIEGVIGNGFVFEYNTVSQVKVTLTRQYDPGLTNMIDAYYNPLDDLFYAVENNGSVVHVINNTGAVISTIALGGTYSIRGVRVVGTTLVNAVVVSQTLMVLTDVGIITIEINPIDPDYQLNMGIPAATVGLSFLDALKVGGTITVIEDLVGVPQLRVLTAGFSFSGATHVGISGILKQGESNFLYVFGINNVWKFLTSTLNATWNFPNTTFNAAVYDTVNAQFVIQYQDTFLNLAYHATFSTAGTIANAVQIVFASPTPVGLSYLIPINRTISFFIAAGGTQLNYLRQTILPSVLFETGLAFGGSPINIIRTNGQFTYFVRSFTNREILEYLTIEEGADLLDATTANGIDTLLHDGELNCLEEEEADAIIKGIKRICEFCDPCNGDTRNYAEAIENNEGQETIGYPADPK